MLDPQDVVALLNAAESASKWGNQSSVTVAHAQLTELLTVWLRVAAKHEEIALRPHLYAPEMRELVAAMLLGTPDEHKTDPLNEPPSDSSFVAAAREVYRPPHPFIRCVCGDEFLPGAPHCPHCGRFLQ